MPGESFAGLADFAAAALDRAPEAIGTVELGQRLIELAKQAGGRRPMVRAGNG